MSKFEPFPQKPRRRWFAVSVRTLMLFVLGTGAGLGWKANRAATQKWAVARIREAGGNVFYDYEFSGKYPYKSGASPWAPAWLRGLIGDECFQEVTVVAFYGDKATSDSLAPVEDLDRLLAFELHHTMKVTDAGLAHLRHLRGLRFVEINVAPITDAGLAYLAALTQLQKLSLAGAPGITDVGLVHLGKMTELADLSLRQCTGITGAGLVHLAGLPHLRRMSCYDITDAGLAHLGGLTSLHELNLSHTPITGTGLGYLTVLGQLEKLHLQGARNLTAGGLVQLEGLRNLRTLDLAGTMITDDSLEHLAGMTELRELNLSANLISDAGLAHLSRLRLLRELNLDQTRASVEGIAALTAAIPKLAISHQNLAFPGAPGPTPARDLGWLLFGGRSKE